jgi:hypothetical protein
LKVGKKLNMNVADYHDEGKHMSKCGCGGSKKKETKEKKKK